MMTTHLEYHNDWSLNDGKVTKECSYSGLLGADEQQHTLLFEISTSRSHQTGLLEPNLRLVLSPDPLPDIEGSRFAGQLIVPSTPFNPDPVPVKVTHAEDATLVITTTTPYDAEDFVQTISSGESLKFVLLRDNEHLIVLPIPNELSVTNILRKALD